MTGIVLDAQQIQNAPAPVRLWLEQQISAALGPRPAPGASSPRLVACTEAQAANLGLINQAFAEMCDDAAAGVGGFDAAGRCSILPTTQSSIAALWKAIIAAERPGVLPIAAAE